MESAPPSGFLGTPSFVVRMFGPLTIRRDDVALTLPASRKVRALFAYLSLAPHAVTRSQLCDLLWEVPNDPRGELRWCLSKIRGLIDDPGRHRVNTHADTVSLDLTDCFVDVIEVNHAIQHAGQADLQRLRILAALFTGDFLEGLETDRSPAFSGWLAGQRRRFRGFYATLLEQLATQGAENEVLEHLRKWLELAPFDPRVHAFLFKALARHGQIREGEEHLAATSRLFESEGIDVSPIRDAWRSARAQRDSSPRSQEAAPAVSGAAGFNPAEAVTATPRRASIAVMPFVDRSSIVVDRGGTASGLARDVITRLAKLRSLFVIAEGTVFAVHERHIGPEEAGRMLNVDYVVSGFVQFQGRRFTVIVELTETRTARIIWAETFDQALDDAFTVFDQIGNRIVASLDHEIETVERNRAVLRPPNSLDAWEAYHRGLWHVYRFNKPDNDLARHFFEMAVRLDRTFSRAYAGLSFAHFQNVFQGWKKREPEIDRAFKVAGQGIMADDRDPAAHWAMGRALWLRGRYDRSMAELEQAIDLSPNFALGHYTLGFVQSQAGEPYAAIASVDHSRRLSPFDPLLFGMFGARAMALVRIGRFEEAADWGVKAAARPNAHPHILAIAAFSLALADRLDDGRAYLSAIHKALPSYRVDDFLVAMQFAPEGEKLFREAAKRLEMR